MKDRVSTYPGRVRMTPVSGQTNVYDLERADQPTEEGTPLNKANLLTDYVAALFGLGSSAVPNDVFAVLADIRKHYWYRQKLTYTYSQAVVTWYYDFSSNYGLKFGRSSTSGANTTLIIKTSSSFTVDPTTGEINLVNPTTQTVKAGMSLNKQYFQIVQIGTSGEVNPSYFKVGETYYYSGSTVKGPVYSDGYYYAWIYRDNTEIVTVNKSISQTKEIANSSNVNDYPVPNGNYNTYFYTYIGTPIDLAVGSIQIETGSYVGTGVNVTADAPFELTLTKPPKVLFVCKTMTGITSAMYNYMIPFYGQTGTEPNTFYQYGYDRWGTNYLYIRLVNNKIQWYSINTGSPLAYDLNESGSTYHWMAFV